MDIASSLHHTRRAPSRLSNLSLIDFRAQGSAWWSLNVSLLTATSTHILPVSSNSDAISDASPDDRVYSYMSATRSCDLQRSGKLS